MLAAKQPSVRIKLCKSVLAGRRASCPQLAGAGTERVYRSSFLWWSSPVCALLQATQVSRFADGKLGAACPTTGAMLLLANFSLSTCFVSRHRDGRQTGMPLAQILGICARGSLFQLASVDGLIGGKVVVQTHTVGIPQSSYALVFVNVGIPNRHSPP